MRVLTVLCSLACVGLSLPAHAQTSGTASSIAATVSPDCATRMAAVRGNRSSTIATVRLMPGNSMPVLPFVEPRHFTISVVVDTVGRAEVATLEVPADVDSVTAEAMRKALTAWQFSPARLSGCPIRQVVRLRVSRW